jgi:hypothetical protein
VTSVIAMACAEKVIKQTLWKAKGEFLVKSGAFPPADPGGDRAFEGSRSQKGLM